MTGLHQPKSEVRSPRSEVRSANQAFERRNHDTRETCNDRVLPSGQPRLVDWQHAGNGVDGGRAGRTGIQAGARRPLHPAPIRSGLSGGATRASACSSTGGRCRLKGTEIGWSRGGDRRGYGSKGTEVPVEVYDNLYKEFNPTNFNAHEWVAIAKAAGMKYLVFTSRHHDGFSMFDTKAERLQDHHRPTARSAATWSRNSPTPATRRACASASTTRSRTGITPTPSRPTATTDYLAYLKQQVTRAAAPTTARSTSSGSTASASRPRTTTARAW